MLANGHGCSKHDVGLPDTEAERSRLSERQNGVPRGAPIELALSVVIWSILMEREPEERAGCPSTP